VGEFDPAFVFLSSQSFTDLKIKIMPELLCRAQSSTDDLAIISFKY